MRCGDRATRGVPPTCYDAKTKPRQHRLPRRDAANSSTPASPQPAPSYVDERMSSCSTPGDAVVGR
eukprot:4682919-Lingulodinium_polyedra.AAC.1